MFLILKPSLKVSHRRTLTGRSIVFEPLEPVEVTAEEAEELRFAVGHSIVLPQLNNGIPTSKADYDATNRFLEGSGNPYAAPEPNESGGDGDNDGDLALADSLIPESLHEHLIAAGLDTLQKIDAYLAVDGNSLEDLEGIGPASAKKILEALAQHSEGA